MLYNARYPSTLSDKCVVSSSWHCKNDWLWLSYNCVAVLVLAKILECREEKQKFTMCYAKHTRYVVLLLLATVFIYLMAISICKLERGKVGLAQSTKSASEMFYPSVTMAPLLELNESLAKLSSFNKRKNLTEYYTKISGIKGNIISIRQSYETGNG